MADIKQFTGATRDNTKIIFFCTGCESRSFKLVKRGASDEITIECANCEDIQKDMEVIIHG